MRIRYWLDRLAMTQYIMKVYLQNAKAIYKARSDYHKIKPDFLNDRKINLQKTSVRIIPEQIKNSILWQFYAKRVKRFSQLSDFK